MDDDVQVEESNSSSGGRYVLGGLAALALAGAGYFFLTDTGTEVWVDPDAEAQAEGAAANDLEKEPLAEKPEETILEARGLIQAAKEATIASRITARITSMPYSEGASFGRGAVLARFDCSQVQAQLGAANAAAAAYAKTYETNVELDAYEAIGTNEVAVSKANLAKARAEASAIRASLNDCSVRAPFGGTVIEQIAHTGEVAASGQPMLRIQGGGSLEAELIVPSNWLTWMQAGRTFKFTIDETGVVVDGSVSRIGPSVDPVSKTVRVIGNINTGDGLILPGMSGTAVFDMPEPEQPETEAAEGSEMAETEAATDGQKATTAPQSATEGRDAT